MHNIHADDCSLTRRLPCPEGPPSRRSSQITVATLAAGLLMALSAPDASAALSRWSASNNRIYVYGGGTMTLTDLRTGTLDMPDAALQRIDQAAGIWLLTANIVVEDGTTLSLTGDVKELRLQSNPSSTPATDVFSFVNITAGNDSDHPGPGTIIVDGVKVTSWDTNANAPDTNTADGRAFLRARSQLLTTGPAESRMDILNSEIQYLGWNASESYGLSWKVNGDLALINVFGNIKSSKIHHNHYGAYTFGMQGNADSGQITGNEIYSNDGYGFDAHDHSDDLVIDANNVHDNGKVDDKGRHGIILSESCLNAKITNNTANANGGTDSVTGAAEGAGIMLHNFSDGATVQGNTTSGNVDTGIAVFCSTGALVKGNTVADNGQYGIRLTVAASDNAIEGNTVSGSGVYGLLLQPATDSNHVCGDLTPRNNTFTGNTVGTSGTAAVKITDATANTFTGNTFNDSGVSIRNSLSTSEQVVNFDGNTFGSGVVVRMDGALDRPLRGNFTKTSHVSMEVDTGSVAHFSDDAGAIFDLARDLLVQVNGSTSVIDLNADNAGNTGFVVDTRKLFVTTDGTLVEVAPTQWDTSGDYGKAWIARAQNPAGTVQYKVGDMQSGVNYDVTRNGTAVGTFLADGTGQISFSDSAASTATQTYMVKRSAQQPQSGTGGGSTGGEEGGGGGGPLTPALLVLLAAAGLARRARARS
jgi:mannuronan 5-epimerase